MKTKPLVIYAFTHNDAFKKRIISETSSGTVAFNDVMIQVMPACYLLFLRSN